MIWHLSSLELSPSPSANFDHYRQAADAHRDEQAGLVVQFEEPYAHGVDESASNHSSHKGGNNSLHVRSLLPYLLTDIVPQMSRLTFSNKGFTAHLRSPAPTCTHLHSPALALRASAV